MADISARVNKTSNNRIYCYRFRCVWSNHQSFSHFLPQGETCAYFWEIHRKDPVETLEQSEVRLVGKLR